MSNDVTIKCQDCGNSFIFSESEQRFYEVNHYIPPKRCKACRNARTLRINNKNNKNNKNNNKNNKNKLSERRKHNGR